MSSPRRQAHDAAHARLLEAQRLLTLAEVSGWSDYLVRAARDELVEATVAYRFALEALGNANAAGSDAASFERMGSSAAGLADVSAPPITILIVDDAPDMRILARAYLERAGIEVVGEAADGQEAIARYRALEPPPIPTVILLDNRMPTMTGMEAAAEILAEMPDQLIVLFTAYPGATVAAEASRLGVAACVSKTDLGNLPTIVRDLVAARA